MRTADLESPVRQGEEPRARPEEAGHETSLAAVVVTALAVSRRAKILRVLARPETCCRGDLSSGSESVADLPRWHVRYGLPPVQDITRLRAGTTFREQVAAGRLVGESG